MFNILKHLTAASTNQHRQRRRPPQLQIFILEPSSPLGQRRRPARYPSIHAIDEPFPALDSPALDSPALDLPTPDPFPDLSLDTEDLAPLPYITVTAEIAIEPTLTPAPPFNSGTFTVGDSGQVSIDFLFDGGAYNGELALFNLESLDRFD